MNNISELYEVYSNIYNNSPHDKLVKYLLDNNICESVENAENIIDAMSDDWAIEILDEGNNMRTLRNIAGKTLRKTAQITGKAVKNSKAAKNIKRFIKYTALGMLPL